MRIINKLSDVQIVLKELLDWKDTQISKAKDQRGHQIKNAGDATQDSDLVTLRQLKEATGAAKNGNTTLVSQTFTGGSGGGIPGPPGPAGPPGPQGIPGTSAAANIVQEIPTGTLNSTNTTFTLSHIPLTGSLILQLNGVTQMPGVEFILSGSTITYIFAPKATDWHIAQYLY